MLSISIQYLDQRSTACSWFSTTNHTSSLPPAKKAWWNGSERSKVRLQRVESEQSLTFILFNFNGLNSVSHGCDRGRNASLISAYGNKTFCLAHLVFLLQLYHGAISMSDVHTVFWDGVFSLRFFGEQVFCFILQRICTRSKDGEKSFNFPSHSFLYLFLKLGGLASCVSFLSNPSWWWWSRPQESP